MAHKAGGGVTRRTSVAVAVCAALALMALVCYDVHHRRPRQLLLSSSARVMLGEKEVMLVEKAWAPAVAYERII